MTRKPRPQAASTGTAPKSYELVLGDVVGLLEAARRTSARSINAVMTATYWLIGRRIVEHEQQGHRRARYGETLITRLAKDLTTRFGRGFSQRNLEQMRSFYASFPIAQTLSAQSAQPAASTSAKITKPGKSRRSSRQPLLAEVAPQFPLPWSHYIRLLAVKNLHARSFYEAEALRGGWSIRQLDRQIDSMFYERAALSRNKAAMLRDGQKAHPKDAITAEEELKDPFVLEFLGLKDEYSESELEDALIHHLQTFLLELGGEFAFVARQRRLRIGDEWYRVDLVFFHRRLRCLVIMDLKLGKFTHADSGQMHLYLNYARHHWMMPGENPPVGVILCSQRNSALAQYALEGLHNAVLAAEYRTRLPNEEILVAELEKSRRLLEGKSDHVM